MPLEQHLPTNILLDFRNEFYAYRKIVVSRKHYSINHKTFSKIIIIIIHNNDKE